MVSQAVAIVMFEVELLKKHWLMELRLASGDTGSYDPGGGGGAGAGGDATVEEGGVGRHRDVGLIVEKDSSMDRLEYRVGGYASATVAHC